MSEASAGKASDTPDVQGRSTGVQPQQGPTGKIHHAENFVDGGERACAPVGEGGHAVVGFASNMTGNDSNSSITASVASYNIAASPADSTGGAQNGAANALTSSGGRSISPSLPPLPPPPPYDAALSMPLSPRRDNRSAVTEDAPSIAVPDLPPYGGVSSPVAATRGTPTTTLGRIDSAHVSPSSPPHCMPLTSPSPGARTKITTTTSPRGTGVTAAAAAAAAAGAGAAAGAVQNVLLGHPPPPPYEVMFSPVEDKTSASEYAEAPGGDSEESCVAPEGLDEASAVPPWVPLVSNPVDALGGEVSSVFGASQSLGVPTTGDNIQEEAGGEENKEEQHQQQKKIDRGGSAVSRLRQMFERNNSDSKKRAILEARPLRRPIAATAASSIGEHEVLEETAAVAPASVGVSLQKLLFGSSSDAGELKTSDTAVGGSASGVQHGQKESPDAQTGLPGVTRGQTVGEFPLAAASIADIVSATVENVIEEDAASSRPETASVAEIRSEDWIQVANSSVPTTVPVEGDKLAPTSAAVSGGGVEDSTSLLPVGSATLLHGSSTSASMADQIPAGERVEAVAMAAAAGGVEQAAGHDRSTTAVDDVQAKVEPMTAEEERGSDQRISASEGLVEEEVEVVPAAALGGESGAVGVIPVSIEWAGVEAEQTMEELAGDGTVPAEVDTTSPAVDDSASSLENAEAVAPAATQRSSVVPVVGAAFSVLEYPSGNAATDNSPTEQLVADTAADDGVVDAGPETEAEQPLPVTEPLMKGGAALAAVQKKDVDEDREQHAAGAASVSRVEELRQMFDNKWSGDEPVGVAGVTQDAPAGGGDNPAAAMPLSPTEEAGEDDQPGRLQREDNVTGGGDVAIAGAVLETAHPSTAITDHLPDMAMADMAPIGMVDDVVEEDTASVTPGAASMAEARLEEETQVAVPCVAMPLTVQHGAPEVLQDFAAAGSDGALPAVVDAAVADTVDGCADGESTGQASQGDEEVIMAGGVPFAATVAAVPDAESDGIEALGDQPAPTGAPVPGGGVEGSTSPVPVGSAALVHGFSTAASMADQMHDSERVEAVTAASGVQAESEPMTAEEEPFPEHRLWVSENLAEEETEVVPAAAADGKFSAVGAEPVSKSEDATPEDVQAGIEAMTPEEESEQQGSVIDTSVEEEVEVVAVAASVGESGTVEVIPMSIDSAGLETEQTMAELAGNAKAPAEADTVSPAVDDTASSLERAEAVAPTATQVSSVLVDDLPEIGAALSAVVHPSGNAATHKCSIEQLVADTAADNEVVDGGAETEVGQPVPVTQASVEDEAVLPPMVPRKYVEEDGELNVVGAAPVSRVEELRQMFDNNASRSDDETVGVAGVTQGAPAGGGDNPVVVMPFSLAKEAREDEQPGGLERADVVTGGGDVAVAGADAVLETIHPSTAVADQLPDMAMADMAPIATVDDVIEEDAVSAASATLGAASMADERSEDEAQVTVPLVTKPVAVQDCASKVSQNGSDGALLAFVDVAVADTKNGSADGEGRGQDNQDDVGVTMAGRVPFATTMDAVPDAEPDAIDAVTDEPAPTSPAVSSGGVEGSSSPVPVGLVSVVHGSSTSASMADRITPGEPIEATAMAAAGVEQAAGDDGSVTLDIMQAGVELMMPEGDLVPDQRISASDVLVEEEVEVVPVAAVDEEFGAVESMPVSIDSAGVGAEQTMEELAGNDTAPAEVDTASPAVDDSTSPVESAETVAPAATQLSSVLVDGLPEVGAALSVVEGPFANAATKVSPVKELVADAAADNELAAGGGAAALGAMGAAVGLSGDKPSAEVDASMPSMDGSVDVPSGEVDASVLSVDVKKPKKDLFGGMFGSSESKIEVPDVDAAAPEVSADVSVPDAGASLPEVSGDVSLPEVSEDLTVPDVSVSAPDLSGEVSVPDVSGDVSMPSLDVSAPSASVEDEVPSVNLAGKVPGMPSVEGDLSADVPSGEVSVAAPGVKVEGGSASLTAGLAAGGVAAEGAVDAAVGLSDDKLSAEVDASMPSVDGSVDVPSGDVDASVSVKMPKKGLFGGMLGSSKGKIEVPEVPEVPEVDATLPEVSGDVSLPEVSGDAALPNVNGYVPDVSAGVSVPDVSADVAVPDVSADVSVPDVSGAVDVEGAVPSMDVSGGVDAPSVDVDAPTAFVDMPSVDLVGTVPDMPAVEGDISGDLPSGDVSVTAAGVKVRDGDVPLTAGLAAGAVAAVGSIGAAVGLSGDKPDAEVDASVSAPDAPSVEVKKLKTSKFGIKVPDVDASVDVPSISADVAVPDVPSVDASVDVASVGAEAPLPSASVDVPWVSGDTSLPSASVDVLSVSGDASLPSASVDMPSGEVDASMPSVGNISADVGAKMGDVTADIGASVDDIAAKAPDMLSVEVKKPKKGLFGGLSFKNPPSKGQLKVQDVSAPEVDVDVLPASVDVPAVVDVDAPSVSAPDLSGSMPDVFGDVVMPSVDVSAPSAFVEGEVPSVDLAGKVPDMPSVGGGILGDFPSGEVSVTAPSVSAEEGDASLTAGLAIGGGVATLGALDAAVGLSGDKPSAEVDASMPSVDGSVNVPSGEMNASVPSVDVKKPKKGLFGGIFGGSKGKIEVPEVPEVDATLPEVSGDAALPDVSMVDAGPETGAKQPVPVTGALAEGNAVLTAVEKIGDEEDDDLNVAGASPVSRVEDLRRMFGNNASRSGDEPDGVAGVAQDAPAGGVDKSVAALPLSPAEEAGEDEQPVGVEREDGAIGDGGIAIAGAVLDTAKPQEIEPSDIADQLPETGMADMAPITTVDDVVEDAASVTPGAVSMAEVRSGEGAQVAVPYVTVPVTGQDGAPEDSQDLAATGSDGALPSSVDVAVADTPNDSTDVGRTEQANADDKEVTMVGGVPVAATVAAVPDAESDAIDAVTAQLAPTGTAVSGGGVEGSTSPMPVGSAPLVYDLSTSASMADQIPAGEPVEAVSLPAAAVEQAAGDDGSVKVNTAQANVEPMMPEGENVPDQRISASEVLVEEEVEVVAVAAADGELGTVEAMPVSIESAGVEAEQTIEELARNDTTRAEVEMASRTVDETTSPVESAEAVAPAATQLSSVVVDGLLQVGAASIVVEGPLVNAAAGDLPIEQLVLIAAAGDEVVDAGPETEDEQPVPVTKASAESCVVLAAVEKKGDKEYDELNVAGAAAVSRVEDLRQMFDNNASRADNEAGEVAGVAHDASADGGDNPVVGMPLSPAKEAGEDEQPGDLEREDVVTCGGDVAVAVAGAVLDTSEPLEIEPSEIADQLPEMGMADMAPITTVDDVMEISQEDAAPVDLGPAAMADERMEEGAQVALPCVALPVTVQDTAPELPQELAATGSDGAVPASVDVAVADTIDGYDDGERTEQDDQDDMGVTMAAWGPGAAKVPAAPDAKSAATDAVTDQLALTGATVSSRGVVDSSTSPVPVGAAAVVHSISPSASMADQIPAGEQGEAVAVAAFDAVEHAVGDDGSATLDNMQAEVELTTPEGDLVSKQLILASEGLVEEDVGVIPVAGADGEFGAVEAMPVSIDSGCVEAEQTMEELAGDGTAPAEVDTASSSVNDSASPVESTEAVVPAAAQLSSVVVDGLPQVGAASSFVEDPTGNAAPDDSPIEQLVADAASDDEMVDAGPETEIGQPVPATKASVVGDVMLAAAMQKKDDEEDEELHVAGAAPARRVEELRQMFDNSASPSDDETVGVAGVAQDAPAGGGDNPVAAMPLSPTEEAGENDQPGVLEREDDVTGGGDVAIADAVLDTAHPSAAVADQLPAMVMADVTPIATVDGEIEAGRQVTEPCRIATPVALQHGAPEFSQDLAAMGQDGALLASRDVVGAGIVDSAIDGKRTEQDKEDNEEAKMADEGPDDAVVADSSAIATVTDQLAPTGAALSGRGVEDGASRLSVGPATLVHGLVHSASVPHQIPGGGLAEAVVMVSGGQQAAEEEVSVTLDDVQPEVEPVTPEEGAEPAQPYSAGEVLAEEEEAMLPAAATDGESIAGEAVRVSSDSAGAEAEQTVGELVSDGAALEEVGTARPADDDTAGPSDSTEALVPVASQLSSAVVAELPEVEPPATVAEDPSSTLSVVDDAASSRLGTASVAEFLSEDWVQVAEPSVRMPVTVEDTAPEVSQDLAATAATGALPVSVDAAVADAVNCFAGGETTGQDNRDNKEMAMTGEGPVSAVVTTTIFDEIEAVTYQLAPDDALLSKDSTVPLPVGSANLVGGSSYSASVADLMSASEPVDAVAVVAAGQQAAGDDVPVTLDEVHAQVEPVTTQEETEPEQRVPAGEASVEGEGAVVPVAAPGSDGGSSGGEASVEAEQTEEQLVSGGTAPAEAFIVSPEGDDTAGLSESAGGGEPGNMQRPVLVVDGLPEVEPTAAISEDPGDKSETANSRIEQLRESAVGDELIDAGPGTEPEPPVPAAETFLGGVVVDATGEVNAVPEMMPTTPDSGMVGAEGPELDTANELVSGNTAPAEADTTTPAVNDDKEGSFESAEIVELSEAQPPTTGGALSDAGPEYEHPIPEAAAVWEGGVAAPGDAEEACAGEVALTSTESAGVEAKPGEIANGNTAPAMLAPAPAPEDYLTPASGGLVSPDTAVVEATPKGDGESVAEKKKNPFATFLPKLLGWDKKDKPHSRVVRVERATQEAGSEEAAGKPLASTAAGALERMETAGQVANSASNSVNGKLPSLALDGPVPPAVNAGGPSPSIVDQRTAAVDAVGVAPDAGGVTMAEPLEEEMMVPVAASGGVVSDTLEKKRLSYEAGDRDQGGGLVVTATAPMAVGMNVEESTSTNKKSHHTGGFSFPQLFGWVKQDKTSSRAGSVDTATPHTADEIPTEGMENPSVDADDEFSIAAAMMSAEGGSEAFEAVPDATKTDDDDRATGHVEEAESAKTREPVPTEDAGLADISPEVPLMSTDTDIYDLKVQVGAEHAFPVVALDVPVAEVSPLAHHFSTFDRNERSPATAGASTLPVEDERAPRMDVEGTTNPTSERLGALRAVAAVDETARSEEPVLVSATGNSTTLDDDTGVVDLPPSGAEETPASAGVDVCGITATGIADTTAAFGVVDLSALMAEATVDKVSPSVEPPAPTANFRGPRRSLSPGWKKYVSGDASSASPESAGAAGAVDQAGVSLEALPGRAEGRAGAAGPYASSPPDTPGVNVCSLNMKDCVIS